MICCKANTVCPQCKHEFLVVPWQGAHMSGGGIMMPQQSPEPLPDAAINVFITPRLDGAGPPQPSPVLHVHHHHHHHHNPQPAAAPMQVAEVEEEEEEEPQHDLPTTDTVRALRRSGWYYENITYQDSQEMLKDKQLGTFIVRDSSDARFLYSLSVQTERGPTSVRIHFNDGRFRLDSQLHIQASMPSFPTVIELVEHYVEQSQRANSTHVWVDPKGKLYSPITITRPLVREGHQPSGLKHLARLAVNGAMKRSTAGPITPPMIEQLELPASVSQYLAEYPYSI